MAFVLALMAFVPSVSGAGLQVDLRSLHSVTLAADNAVGAEQAAAWRQALDGDASGEVSAAEVSVGLSALEEAIGHPEFGATEVYAKVQSLENSTGSAFTIGGRGNLSLFIVANVNLFRFSARLDGTEGALARVALTTEGLAGAVEPKTSFHMLEEISFSWEGAPASGQEHRLELEAAPLLPLRVQVSGGFEIFSWVGVDAGQVDAGRSTLTGYSQSSVGVVVRERPASLAAQGLVLGAILVGAGAAAVASLVFATRHEVAEKPLPVVPKYK